MNENQSLVEKLSKEAVPSLVSGAVATIGANMFMSLDYNQRLPFMGTNLPAWAVVGGTVGGSVLLSEVTKDWVLGKIPVLKDYKDIEERVLGPLLAGTSSYILFKYNFEGTDLTNAVLLGAGSSVVGKYASDMLFNVVDEYEQN